MIEPTQFDNAEFIGFNYAKNAKNAYGKAVHFFLDDYQFNRVWTNPDRYIPMLQKFKYVLTPDFSLYTDFPKPLRIYNHYRKHWLGAYWQIQNSKEKKQCVLNGYMEMLERLQPTKIIFYGGVPDECKGSVVHITQFSEKWNEEELV